MNDKPYSVYHFYIRISISNANFSKFYNYIIQLSRNSTLKLTTLHVAVLSSTSAMPRLTKDRRSLEGIQKHIHSNQEPAIKTKHYKQILKIVLT